MERSVQEGVVEEQAAAFRPALGLAPHHQFTAIGSLQTLGRNTGLRVKVARVQGCSKVELGCSGEVLGSLRPSTPSPGVHTVGCL